MKLHFQTVKNLEFVLDYNNPTMKQHIIKICQTACYELKCIRSIPRYVTEDEKKKKKKSKKVASCVLCTGC